MDLKDLIPKELKDQFIQLLDDKSRRQLRLVNTAWFNLVHYDHFQIYFATPKSLQTIVKQLMRYQWPIGLELLKTINVTSTHLEEQIYKLTQLTSLICRIKPNDEGDNEVKEFNPNWLNLTNLQFLDLTNTPIPVDLVYYCHNLTALRGVSVPHCSRDMREILFMNCTKLEFLAVDALKHGQDPKPPRMDHLNRLTSLIVNWAPPNEIVDVKTMTNLRELGGMEIGGVNIGNLTTLEALYVEHPIIGDISGNKNLTDLELHLDENPSHVTALGSLNALQILNLSLTSDKTHADNNQALLLTPQNLTRLSVTVEGEFNIKNISHLTNLRMLSFCSLDAMQYEVTAEDFKHFSRLTSLTAGELFAVVKYLPELRQFLAMDDFSLSDGSTVDDFDPTCVPKLEHLLLFSNPTPSRVFSKFTALRSLKTLMVHEQPNEVFDYNVLSYMALEDLALRPKKLTREDWLALQKLTNLTSLRISDTEVTDDMTLLTRLTRLKNAEIENAKLEHWLPLTFLQQLSSYTNLKISQQLLDDNFPHLYQHNFNIV